MSAIRSDLPALPTPTGAAPAVRAAQADFFRAAVAQVQTAQAGGPQPTISPMTTEPVRAPGVARDARPGSLLDIRV